MHILFLSDNFPPECNAPATRLYEHAIHWVRKRNQVTVLTCTPNFPDGKVYPGYSNRLYSVENIEGIRVVRVKTYITANKGFLKRILDYISFGVAAFIAGLFQKCPDVIVATSPQLFAALGAWLLSVVRHRPFVFELRDLWPASILAVGAMREGRIINALEKLELFLYRRADSVVCVTQAFRSDLVRRGISEKKITVVLNGVDLSRYEPRSRDPSLSHQYGLLNRFVIGYIGTHGMAHALESVIHAADLLRDRDDICFLFVGAGATRQALIAEAERRQLCNVVFLPSQPKEQMPAVWSLCDVALIHLKDSALFATVIPSKIFEAMGMGLPILIASPMGEASELVISEKAGIWIRPEDPHSLSAQVSKLAESPDQVSQLARQSHSAASRYSRERQAEKMLRVFDSVMAGQGATVADLVH
jgi:colanic acid biosynthesis glycosyl transferase WcaI